MYLYVKMLLKEFGKSLEKQFKYLFRYRQLKQHWEMKTEAAELLQTKLQQSTYHKQQEELDALKGAIGKKKRLS